MPGVCAVLTHEDVPGAKFYGLDAQGPAGARHRPGALPGRAGGAGGGRPSRDGAAGRPTAIVVEYEVREAVTDPRRAAFDASCPRSTIAATAAPPAGPGRLRVRGRRGGHRRVRGRHAGPGLPRPGVRAGGARRGRRGGPVHRHPVAARRPRPDRAVPGAARGEGTADAGRGRRRVRRPRGPVDAGPRVHAGAAHRPPGEDRLQPRGVVLRPCAPPPGPDALRARRHPRRQAASTSGRRSCSTAAPTAPPPPPSSATPPRWASGPYEVAERRGSTPTASTPTTRPAARCAASARCRPATPTSRRWTGWPRRAACPRWRSGSATPSPRARRWPPAR